MKKSFSILVLSLLLLVCITTKIHADPFDDMVAAEYISVLIKGNTALVFMEPILYNKLDHTQKLGTCVIAVEKYKVNNVYVLYMGTNTVCCVFNYSRDYFKVYK